MLTEQFLNELITCRKIAEKADRRRMILDNRHYKNSVSLSSEDSKYKFRMFIRQSDEFHEDFSVGLIWLNPQEYIDVQKSIIMYRCQGPHDGRQELGVDIHHSYHTHTITLSDIQSKRYLKPSNRESTDKFDTFDRAILHFVQHCNIINIDNVIEMPSYEEQLSLDY